MRFVLLLGVALNFAGAVKFMVPALTTAISPGAADKEPGYLQLRLFVAGTCATFGSLYLYLYLNPSYVTPLLVFGAALKTWAFVLSAFLYGRHLMNGRDFAEFGVSNAAVGGLFWVYLATI